MPQYKIFNDVLPGASYAHLLEFLQSSAPYHQITGAHMRMWKAWEGDNQNNPNVTQLLSFFYSHNFTTYLPFNDLVALYYENGNDFVDWHTDGGIYMQPDTPIAVLSLGCERVVQMRQIGDDATVESIAMEPNSLFLMDADFQSHYEHRVPPMPSDGKRWAITLFTNRKNG